MTTQPFSRVLLTNGDGIDAPGLAILEGVARQLASEVWVAAPAHDQSGTSHSLSLHDPLRISHFGERRFAVDGTPGDCMAIVHVAREIDKLLTAGRGKLGDLRIV